MTSEQSLNQALNALSPDLRERVETTLERYREAAELPDDAAILSALPRVWASSDFLARLCFRHPAMLHELATSGELTGATDVRSQRERLKETLAGVDDHEGFNRCLRLFRQREMLRIGWRDLAGWADLNEVLDGMSELAEACIGAAHDWLYDRLCQQWGVPRDSEGHAQRLVILGMGKLGGRELNFSSDIDLVFAYPEAGETDGQRPRANEEFFTRLGRQIIAALDQQTADGQVFRVDMRLRPYGTAGPLVLSFDAMELYYQDQGREWERYAMIKARVVGGDYDRGAELTERLRPFVYRRYLDYGALESLRDMKKLIAREVQRKGREGNIKLGRGGIREVEFLAQAFQLIRGGQDRTLRQRSLLPVLEYLAEAGIIPAFVRDELRDGYRFLRRVENHIQAMNDRQTHDLPTDPTDRARLALSLDEPDWWTLAEHIGDWRRRIEGHFAQVFAAPQTEEASTSADSLTDVWRASLDADAEREALSQAGYADPEATASRLAALRDSRATRSLSATGRTRLDRLMPLLLNAAAKRSNPDTTLDRLLHLLGGIVQRTAYLALLNEHPMALSQLVQLASGSPWIGRLLARHPILLDELLDPRSLYAPLRRDALKAELTDRLTDVDDDDLETQMEVLRRFRQANTLRVAAADLAGALPIMVVSDYLTDIAEVVLDAVLRIAWHHMTQRHGRPLGWDNGQAAEQGFVIIGYGKLASLELGYGSDLDLVFVHDCHGEHQETDGERGVDNQVFFARLAQRIIHILNTPTPGGILYEVDTRLRPSGRAGLVTSNINAFEAYQHNQAWTWEHQALVRSRVVAGNPHLAARVTAIRNEVLSLPRDPDELRTQVRDMRRRMLDAKASSDPNVFDIKADSGGIADIEFMVQYGVLAGAYSQQGLLRHTDNIRLLDEISRSGLMTAEQARRLADAYRAYRARIHRLTLQEQPAQVAPAEFEAERRDVTQAWHAIMGGASTDDNAPQAGGSSEENPA